MKIELNKDQYEKLMKLVFMGEWMINSTRVEDLQEDYEDISSLIYSYANEAGLEKYVDKSEDGKFYPSSQLDDDPELMQFREEYDEKTFWEDLLFKLVDKDMIKEYGEDKLKEFSIDDRIQKEEKFFEKWDNELVDNGLDNFDID